MDKEATARELLDYVAANFVGRGLALDGATSLFEARLLDSVRLVELLGHIEKRFTVRIAPREIVLENFDSVDRIVSYLERKTSAPSC
jgi:acyl carrier protein